MTNENTIQIIKAGIKQPPENWCSKSMRNIARIHYVLSGAATCQGELLSEGSLYLVTYSKEKLFGHVPGKDYLHMHFDFLSMPPLMPDRLYRIEFEHDSELKPLLDLMLHYIPHLYDIETNIFSTNRSDITYRHFRQLADVFVDTVIDRTNAEMINDDRLCECLNMIHSCYDRPLTNEELAKSIHLEVRYFIRYFKERMQMTPQKYLSMYRLQKALELLAMNETVNDTAIACGYRSADTFGRAFTAAYGITPVKYRSTKKLP